MEEDNKPKQKAVEKKYTIRDLASLQHKDNFSAFGNMPLSGNLSEPEIGFGRATRNNREKVYQTKENMKAFLGSRG